MIWAQLGATMRRDFPEDYARIRDAKTLDERRRLLRAWIERQLAREGN